MDPCLTIPGMVLADRVARFSFDPTRPVPLLDDATLERLRRCLSATGQSDARVLVITGGTQGVFAAGADLAQLATPGPADAREFSRKGQALLDSLKSHDFVSIAAVRGRCIGGAFDLAMAYDLRLADTTAFFSHPGPRRVAKIARQIARVAPLRIKCIKEAITHLTDSQYRRRLERPLCTLAALADGAGMGGR